MIRRNWHWWAAYRRYQRLCNARPAGQEPQCGEADTEVGEAWRALPLPIRVWLCVWAGAPGDALWELPRGRASVERAEMVRLLAELLAAVEAFRDDPSPAGRHAELLAELAGHAHHLRDAEVS